jgi:hypothetical protein
MPFTSASYIGSFYKIAKSLPMLNVREVQPEMLLTVSLMLQEEIVEHIRECFNIPDMIGNLGGVVEVFVIVFGVIIYPLSKHKFIMKAL